MKRLIAATRCPAILIIACVVGSAACSRRAAPESAPVKLYPVQIGGQFGFVNENGATVIEPRFGGARLFHENLAAVRSGDKWGYIGFGGDEKIGARFEEAGDLHEGLAAVQEKGRWGFIDSAGQMVIAPQFDAAGYFDGGLANVRAGTKWRFISHRGSPSFGGREFDFAKPFSEGFAAVNIGGAVDANGVFTGGSWGFVDVHGKDATGFRFTDARSFHQEKAAVRDAHSWGFIDRNGGFVIPARFGAVGDFSGGLALAIHDEGWGYIDVRGEWAIPSDYGGATRFNAGRAVVERAGSHWGLIDGDGKPVGPDTFEAPGIFDSSISGE